MSEESGGGNKPLSVKPPTIKPPTAFGDIDTPASFGIPDAPPPPMSMPAQMPMPTQRPTPSAPTPVKQKSPWVLVVLLFLAMDVLIVLGLLFYFWGR